MYKGILGVLLLAASQSAMSAGLAVDVFLGHKQYPINLSSAQRVASVTIYDMSKPEQLEEMLSQGLPEDPVQAQKIAQQRLEALGPSLQGQINEAYAGTFKASEYGIKQLPAVVFNHGESVVYGITDVVQAINIYQARGGK